MADSPVMLLESVKSLLIANNVSVAGRPVVVGVSGGVDSIVLLDVLTRLNATPTAVHFNFGLRGEESDTDEAFVDKFCKSIGVEVLIRRFEPSDKETGSSVQEWARDLRYNEMCRIAERHKAPFVAVAHHEDDQAETVLSHLFRGTGLAGLAGMPFARPIAEGSNVQLIRPLLKTTRRDILAYAGERLLDWRQDSSNLDPKYRRTALRHEILPVIVSHFGREVTSRIAATARIVREMSRVSSGGTACPVVTVDASGRVTVSVEELASVSEVKRSQLILDVLRSHFPQARRTRESALEILSLAHAQVGRRWQSVGMSVTRERDVLLFSRETDDDEDETLPLLLTVGATAISGATAVRADLLSDIPPTLDPGTNKIAFVDADMAGPRLLLDRWRDGDRISLLGASGSQKVSDVLTANKVPHHVRQQIRVVRSDDGRVIWIAGVRVSGDFAVRTETKRVLMLTCIGVFESDASDLASPPVS